jgi:excisionase family DNA binding protein
VEGVREKEVLNVEEAAEFLGFAPYTIREKARDGQIPGRKIGGEWRFSRRRLLEWIEEGDREQVHA